MYDYTTPTGFGDTFYQYVFDAQDVSGIANGQTLFQVGPHVVDGDFLLRYWSGLSTIAQGLKFYDWQGRFRSSDFMTLGTAANQFANMVVTPELWYPDNSYIRQDLQTVALVVAGTDTGTTLYKSQMVYTGAKRRANTVSDPVPSAYKYYEKPYAIPYTLSINNYATTGGVVNGPTQIQIKVEDFDFELRRIELALQDNQQSSQFKVTLYDNNRMARSNRPVLSNMFFHLNPQTSSGEFNFWPCPPILFPVNGAIYFDIWSLLFSPTVLPQTFQLLLHGVRRIPC